MDKPLSTSYFQCQFCQTYCLTTSKVKEHVEKHQTIWNELCETSKPWLKDVLPITKVTFFECHIPLTQVQVEVNEMEQKPLILAGNENGLDSQSASEGNSDDDSQIENSNPKSPRDLQEKEGPSKSKLYECDVCGKRYHNKYNFIDHQYCHEDEEFEKKRLAELNSKKYPCKECGKKFKTLKILKMHSFLHRKKNPFTCTFPGCNKAFTGLYNLKLHEALHINERNVACPLCRGKYSTEEHLKRHIRKFHKPSDMTCPRKVKTRLRPTYIPKESGLNEALLETENSLAGSEVKEESTLALQAEAEPNPPSLSLSPTPTVPPVMKVEIEDVKVVLGEPKSSLTSTIQREDVHESDSQSEYDPSDKSISSDNDDDDDDDEDFEIHVKPTKKRRKRRNGTSLETETPQNDTMFKCGTCDKIFGNKWTLLNHEKLHEDMEFEKKRLEDLKLRIYPCRVCGKRFKYKDNLTRHSNLHNKNNPFRCRFPGCNRKLNCIYNLKRHERLHTLSKSGGDVKCPLCPGKYATMETLKTHMRNMHKPSDIDKPRKLRQRNVRHHPVQRISESQPRPTNVTSNENETTPVKEPTGSGSAAYPCTECNAEFTRAWTLQMHLSSVHQKSIIDKAKTLPDDSNTSVILMCGFCAYPAKNNLDLEMHIDEKHPRRYQCHCCSLRFVSLAKLKEHVREIHEKRLEPQFNCEFCEKTFMKESYLRLHKRKIHDEEGGRKMVECHVCKKMYTGASIYHHLKRHEHAEKIARGEKPIRYQCKLCNDDFASSFVLKRHIDAIHLNKPVNKNQKRRVGKGIKAKKLEWFLPLIQNKQSGESGSAIQTGEGNTSTGEPRSSSGNTVIESQCDGQVSILGM